MAEITRIFFSSPQQDKAWISLRKELAFLVLDIGRRLVPTILDEGEKVGYLTQHQSREVNPNDRSTWVRIVINAGESEFVGVAKGEGEALRRAFLKLFFDQAPWNRAEKRSGPPAEPYQFPSRWVKNPYVANPGMAQESTAHELHEFSGSHNDREIFEFLKSHSISYPCNYTEMLKEGGSIERWAKVRLFYDNYRFFGDNCLLCVTSTARVGGKNGDMVVSHGYGLNQKSAAMSASYSLLLKLHVEKHVQLAPEHLELLGFQALQ